MLRRFSLLRARWLLIVALFVPVVVPVWSADPVVAAAEKSARPLLSPIFGDNMVLQRGKPNTFWGWTKPGETVRVEIAGRSATAVAGADGRWQTQLEPPPPGAEILVTVASGSQRVELQHVLVGDVWLCGGQSNMQYGLPGATNGAREVAEANHPNIRFITVTPRSAYAPADQLQGKWKICTPQTAGEGGGISAVAYFFARRLQVDVDVPIGLVVDCLGGSPAESWMSPATVRGLQVFDPPLAKIEQLREKHAPEYGNYIMHWYDEYDAGIRGKMWSDSDFDDRNWKTVQITEGFKQLGLEDVPAVVWFRKEITLPDPLPAGTATVKLGVVEKMETTYVNGVWTGASSWVENPRAYRVAANVLKPGRNVIATRVFKLKSKAAFLSPPEKLQLVFSGGAEISLAGDWKAAVSVDARPPHELPLGFENYPIMPVVLYQGMLQPAAPLALTGMLWYQGEANASRARQYRTLLPAMIKDWRALFAQGDLPFYIVSLPAWQARRTEPGNSDWAELREAQDLTARSVPNTGLAVTIDTGDAENLHPHDKQPVGERLALLALAGHYGKPVVSSGPVYRSMERSGSTLRIHFDHTDGGLKIHGDKLAEFSVAGSDRKWHWATATIEGDTVVVSSPEVAEPVAVRYAWQANPQATLFNGAGLPAAPFRTDDWPGVTDNRAPW